MMMRASITPMIAEIQQAACEYFRLSKREMQSTCRERRIARPRQIVMYLARQMTKHSLPEIGMFFGGMDHTTIIHGIRNIGLLMGEVPEVAIDVRAVRYIACEIAKARAQSFQKAA